MAVLTIMDDQVGSFSLIQHSEDLSLALESCPLFQLVEYLICRLPLEILHCGYVFIDKKSVKNMDKVQNGRPQNVYLKSVWLK